MSNYIGVEMVHAEESTETNYTGIRVSGYKITYPDGYSRFIEDEDFEKYYFKLENDSTISQSDIDDMLSTVESTQVSNKSLLVEGTTKTGFLLHHVSSCVDPANFDATIGTNIGTSKIKDKLWELLGFVLQWGKNGLNK